MTGKYYLTLKTALTIAEDIFMILENHDKEDNRKVMTEHKSHYCVVASELSASLR